jgi:hypothetical protein
MERASPAQVEGDLLLAERVAYEPAVWPSTETLEILSSGEARGGNMSHFS